MSSSEHLGEEADWHRLTPDACTSHYDATPPTARPSSSRLAVGSPHSGRSSTNHACQSEVAGDPPAVEGSARRVSPRLPVPGRQPEHRYHAASARPVSQIRPPQADRGCRNAGRRRGRPRRRRPQAHHRPHQTTRAVRRRSETGRKNGQL